MGTAMCTGICVDRFVDVSFGVCLGRCIGCEYRPSTDLCTEMINSICSALRLLADEEVLSAVLVEGWLFDQGLPGATKLSK